MFEAFSIWLEEAGSLAYLAAPVFTMLVAILPIPAEIPALLNGMIFGPILGSAVTWLSSIVGAQVSFELARRWGRPIGARLVSPTVIDRADVLVSRAGWPALLALRLMPAVAFTAVNWASGLTAMPRATFFWTTAVGILPGAILFTISGSGLLAFATRTGVEGIFWLAVVSLLLLTALFAWQRTRRSENRADGADSDPDQPGVSP